MLVANRLSSKAGRDRQINSNTVPNKPVISHRSPCLSSSRKFSLSLAIFFPSNRQ